MNAEIDAMAAGIIADHVAREHPGLWCLEGADGRCAGGAPPGVLTVEQLGARGRVDELMSLQPESETA